MSFTDHTNDTLLPATGQSCIDCQKGSQERYGRGSCMIPWGNQQSHSNSSESCVTQGIINERPEPAATQPLKTKFCSQPLITKLNNKNMQLDYGQWMESSATHRPIPRHCSEISINDRNILPNFIQCSKCTAKRNKSMACGQEPIIGYNQQHNFRVSCRLSAEGSPWRRRKQSCSLAGWPSQWHRCHSLCQGDWMGAERKI